MACIWRRSVSGIVHHVWRRVACLGHVAGAGGGVIGLLVYMTQNWERGAIAPILIRRVWFCGKMSKPVTANLVAAFIRSLASDVSMGPNFPK